MSDLERAAPSRRGFLKASAAAAMVGVLPAGRHAGGSDALRVGVVGCGGRGTGAAVNCVSSSPGVRITALGDLFQDRLDTCRRNLEKHGDKVDLDDERCFTGFRAYERVIASDVDLVILATPPGFRPQHLRAAVEAGRHVFMEKPVAVDPPGVHSVIESSELARSKGLAIVAGTQRRHQEAYLEAMRRIHDGAIGEIVGGQCYWNQGGLWVKKRRSGMTDMEWQVRNWLYFTWLSGDHIVEQHVHNIDVMNWALDAHPVRALGLGGRQARTAPEYGHVFDHFAVEYEYPGGVRVLSMCRQIEGTPSRVGEHVVGTRGTADPGHWIKGPEPWRYGKRHPEDPYVREHADLVASIRAGEPLNEGRRIAESTLTAIMGRMSAYTGQEVTWDFATRSRLDLSPQAHAFGDLSVPPVAVPGKTKLI